MIIHIIILISVIVLGGSATKKSTYAARRGQTISLSDDSTNKLDMTTRGAFMALIVLLFFATFRSGFIDTNIYTALYEQLDVGFDTAFNKIIKEYNDSGLFWGIAAIIKTIFGEDYAWLFFFSATYCIFGYVKIFKTFSFDYKMSLFFVVCTFEYTWVLNGVKQACAIATILLFSDSILKRNLPKFAIGLAIAYLFHPSVLIWIPVYFFIDSKPWSKKMIIFILGIVFSVLFLDLFTNVLDSVLEGSTYDGMTENFDSKNGSSLIRTAFFFIPPFLAFKDRYEIEKVAPPYILYCINLSVVVAGIYMLASFTSGMLMGRIPGHFSCFSWVYMSWLLQFYKSTGRPSYASYVIYIYVAYFLYGLIFTNYGSYESNTLGIHLN